MKFPQKLSTIWRYLSPSGSVTFWHTAVSFREYDFPTLNDYYIDFRSKADYKGPFEDGIPLLDYKGTIGVQYNPCAIAQYGIGCFQLYKEGGENYYKTFLKCASWLKDNLSMIDEEKGVWLYHFDLDAYGVKSPWVSALAQGQGVSLLLRAYLTTKDQSYLMAAEKAFMAMITPIVNSGMLRIENGDYYLEEVVADRLTGILDGMIFSIFSVYDYVYATDSQQAKDLLEKLVNTLVKILPDYELGFWSRADLYNMNPPMIASPFYHGLHVEQLKALYKLTNMKIFDTYSKRWDRYQHSILAKGRAIANKVIFKLMHY